jgi:hypothetical protein
MPSSKSVHVIGNATSAFGGPGTLSGLSSIPPSQGSSTTPLPSPSGYYDSTFEYDPTENEWRRLETRGSGKDYRAEHTAVVLTPHGKHAPATMYVFGGWSIAITESVHIDPHTGVETHRYGTAERRVNTLSALNLSTGEWSIVQQAPTVLVPTEGGELSASVSALGSPTKLRQAKLQVRAEPAARAGHAAVGVASRYMVVHGGVTTCSEDGQPGGDERLRLLNDTWVFDSVDLTWRAIAVPPPSGADTSNFPTPPARYGHSLVAHGSSILVMGGRLRGKSGSAEVIWQLDLATEQWRDVSLLGLPRERISSSTLWMHQSEACGTGDTSTVVNQPLIASTRPRFRGTATLCLAPHAANVSRALRRGGGDHHAGFEAGASGEEGITIVVIGGLPSSAPAAGDLDFRSTTDDLAQQVRAPGSSGDHAIYFSRSGPTVLLSAAAVLERITLEDLIALPPAAGVPAAAGAVGFGNLDVALEVEKQRRRAQAKRQAEYAALLHLRGAKSARTPTPSGHGSRRRPTSRHGGPAEGSSDEEDEEELEEMRQQAKRDGVPFFLPKFKSKEAQEKFLHHAIHEALQKKDRNAQTHAKARLSALDALLEGSSVKVAPEVLEKRLARLYEDAALTKAKKKLAQEKMWRDWHAAHGAAPPPKQAGAQPSTGPGKTGKKSKKQASTVGHSSTSELPPPTVTPWVDANLAQCPPGFHDDRRQLDDRMPPSAPQQVADDRRPSPELSNRRKVIAL